MMLSGLVMGVILPFVLIIVQETERVTLTAMYHSVNVILVLWEKIVAATAMVM